MGKRIRVKVPATTANLGPGFDVLGAALSLYNEIEVTFDTAKQAAELRRPTICIEGEGKESLPRDGRNIVWQSIAEVLRSAGRAKFPLITSVRLFNNIPLASGLGSSAAARLGGILAADAIGGLRLSPEKILSFGVKLEGHPDNIVPALLGGLCVSCLQDDLIHYVKMPAPRLKAVVCNPDFELATAQSRKVLPERVSLRTATFNSSRLALLMAAFLCRRYDLLGVAMEDRFHQPARAHLVPRMAEVFAAARRAGAYGAALSGAGPSIIALCSAAMAPRVGHAMRKTWKQFNIASRCFALDFDGRGAVVK
jgi:homoserine kinase